MSDDVCSPRLSTSKVTAMFPFSDYRYLFLRAVLPRSLVSQRLRRKGYDPDVKQSPSLIGGLCAHRCRLRGARSTALQMEAYAIRISKFGYPVRTLVESRGYGQRTYSTAVFTDPLPTHLYAIYSRVEIIQRAAYLARIPFLRSNLEIIIFSTIIFLSHPLQRSTTPFQVC